ncbi:MAG TPA: hypothetical protein VHX59_09920 [Mycobacteriales bacterium]|nr:hypothetical protein [Mycobacteriales bacterium]
MSEPSRRGRRDNGLAALAYVPLADVDPRIGDHLLDILWAAGIPAYLEPPPDTDALRQLTAPTQPVDRLWVDGDRRVDARSLVEAEAAQLPTERVSEPAPADVGYPDDIDSLGADELAAWDELVTQFSDGPDAPDDAVHPWPAAEDLDVPTRAPDRPRQPPPADEPRGRDLLDAIDALDGLGDDDEGHFEPPPPPPIPRLSKYAALALAMMAGGVVLLFVPGLAGLSDSSGVFALGVIAIICGAGLLVWRLKEDRGSDGPDDGAIV